MRGNTGPLSVAGSRLTTPKGEYYGFVADGMPGRPPGRALFPGARSRIACYHFRPPDNDVIIRLQAMLDALSIRRAPESMLAPYKDAIEQAKNGNLAVMNISGIAQYPDGKLPSETYPNFGTLRAMLFPWGFRSLILTRLSKLPETLTIPSHAGYGWAPVPLGETLDHMAVYVSLGEPAQARHLVFVGRTRSGKSATVKTLINYILHHEVPGFSSRDQEAQIIIYDTKGEYVQVIDGNKEPLYPEALVVGTEAGLPIGSISISARGQGETTVQNTVVFEAWLINEVLKTLRGRQLLGLERLLIKVVKSGYTPSEASEWIYSQIQSLLGLPSNSPEETIFQVGQQVTNISQQRILICDLARYPYKSPVQQAAFIWLLGSMVPLIASRVRRRLIVLEEYHLLPGSLLGTVLRTGAGMGTSVWCVSQSVEDIKNLGGSGEQFHGCVFMCPGWLHLQQAGEFLYGLPEGDKIYSPQLQRDLNEFWGRDYGWGALITPHAITPFEAIIPPGFLARIDRHSPKIKTDMV